MNRTENVDQIVNTAAAQSQDNSRSRDDYRAMITHDLRTALSGITGGLAQLELRRNDEETLQLVSQMQISARNLADLLDKTFGDGMIEGNNPSITPQVVDLDNLLKEVENLWARQAQNKGLEFELSVAPGCPRIIQVDRVAFHRLIGNLLGNSIKFTDQGTVSVQVSGGDGASDLSIVVSDTGPGFSADALKTIFQMYGRPASSDVPGSGIGLHIAKMITDKMGGEISANNSSHGGAEVSVLIPVPEQSDSTDEPLPDPALEDTGLPDLSKVRILLAEDNSTNQLVVTQMLSAMNAAPVLASDGVEALARFEESDFDVVLLDIEMPRVSGLDVIRQIRNRTDNKSGVCLIALTAYAMKEHRDRIFAVGADGLIPKPLTSIGELGNRILSIFGERVVVQTRSDPIPSDCAESDNDSIVDRKIFGELSEAIGPDSIGELVRKVTEDMEMVSEGVKNSIKKPDYEKIRFFTHILISVAGVVGAKNLQTLAEQLNNLAQKPGQSGIDELASRCINGIAGVLQKLRSELN